MAPLIEQKRALVKERTERIQEILRELKKSNSTFSSSRQLSVFIAEKMEEQGNPVDSSTLRRKGTPYKDLIDEYVGKKEKRADTDTKLHLRIRKQNTEIEELTSRLQKLENEVKDKEHEIRLLLVDAQDKRNEVFASIAPPQASTYKQTELNQLKALHQRDKAQLSKALEVIETLLEFELKTEENKEGSYEIKNGRVFDLLNESELFNEINLPNYFKDR